MTMRLVEIVSSGFATLQLPLQDPSQGYYIQEIEGLNPVESTMVTTKTATRNGVQYQAASQEGRSIVLHLGLNADYVVNSPVSLRRGLYSRLMPGRPVTLKFQMDDHPTVSIAGRVETFETPIFSQDTEAVISILCFDPDFVSDTVTVVNEVTTASNTNVEIINNGDQPTGFIFTLEVDRVLGDFSIIHSGSNNAFNQMDVAVSMIAGDVLEISTVPGSKGAWLTRGAARGSVLYGPSPESPFFKLEPGDNDFRVYAAGAAVPYSLAYVERFGGL